METVADAEFANASFSQWQPYCIYRTTRILPISPHRCGRWQNVLLRPYRCIASVDLLRFVLRSATDHIEPTLKYGLVLIAAPDGCGVERNDALLKRTQRYPSHVEYNHTTNERRGRGG